MSTLDRYIARSFYRGFTLVVLVLVTLFSFAAFVQELNDVGTGDYGVFEAALYVILTIPRRFFDLAPVSGLLGALFSLGSLAAESELIAMRSIGASVSQIASSSLKAAVPVVLLMVLVAQWIGPKYEKEARSLRSAAISKGPALETSEGFWLKDGRNFVRIGTLLGGNIPTDLIVLELDSFGRLKRYLVAADAIFDDGEGWRLRQVSETRFTDIGNTYDQFDEMPWKSELSLAELSKVPLAPETLAPTVLIKEIRHRLARGLATERHALAFWYMVSRPISFLAMLLFAVPFVFSSLRDSSHGRRTVLGAVIGVLAYLLDQISGFAGLIFTVHPAFTALFPPVLIGCVALALLVRAERL